MFGFIDGTKYFKNINGLQVVLNNASFLVEDQQKVGILGGIGSGKSTVIKVLAGMQKLDSGILIKKMACPLGYAGVLHPSLTANENIKIIAQLNYLDPFNLEAFCQDFAEISDSELNTKIAAYSAGLRARLGFALSLAIPCDFFLADEKISLGDSDFRAKCELALELKLKHSGLVLFSSNPRLTQKMCDIHGVLREGKIIIYTSHEEACHFFEQDMSKNI